MFVIAHNSYQYLTVSTCSVGLYFLELPKVAPHLYNVALQLNHVLDTCGNKIYFTLRSMIDQTYNLVSHIYGPYPHYVLFSEKFPVAGKIPVLSNFQMLCDNKPIG